MKLIKNKLLDSKMAGGFFLIETQMDIKEAKAAVLAVKDIAPEIPFVVSFTFEQEMVGPSPEVRPR